MWNAELNESEAEIKIAGRNINNLRWCLSNDKKWKGTIGPLNEGESGEWKSWFKTQH